MGKHAHSHLLLAIVTLMVVTAVAAVMLSGGVTGNAVADITGNAVNRPYQTQVSIYGVGGRAGSIREGITNPRVELLRKVGNSHRFNTVETSSSLRFPSFTARQRRADGYPNVYQYHVSFTYLGRFYEQYSPRFTFQSPSQAVSFSLPSEPSSTYRATRIARISFSSSQGAPISNIEKVERILKNGQILATAALSENTATFTWSATLPVNQPLRIREGEELLVFRTDRSVHRLPFPSGYTTGPPSFTHTLTLDDSNRIGDGTPKKYHFIVPEEIRDEVVSFIRNPPYPSQYGYPTPDANGRFDAEFIGGSTALFRIQGMPGEFVFHTNDNIAGHTFEIRTFTDNTGQIGLSSIAEVVPKQVFVEKETIQTITLSGVSEPILRATAYNELSSFSSGEEATIDGNTLTFSWTSIVPVEQSTAIPQNAKVRIETGDPSAPQVYLVNLPTSISSPLAPDSSNQIGNGEQVTVRFSIPDLDIANMYLYAHTGLQEHYGNAALPLSKDANGLFTATVFGGDVFHIGLRDIDGKFISSRDTPADSGDKSKLLVTSADEGETFVVTTTDLTPTSPTSFIVVDTVTKVEN